MSNVSLKCNVNGKGRRIMFLFYVDRKRTECSKYCRKSEIIKALKMCFVLVFVSRAGGGRVKNQTHAKYK
jgi:hypothetical protein